MTLLFNSSRVDMHMFATRPRNRYHLLDLFAVLAYDTKEIVQVKASRDVLRQVPILH